MVSRKRVLLADNDPANTMPGSNDDDRGWIKVSRKKQKTQHPANGADDMALLFGGLSLSTPPDPPPVSNIRVGRTTSSQQQDGPPRGDARTFQFNFPELSSHQPNSNVVFRSAEPPRQPSAGTISYATMAARLNDPTASLPAKFAQASGRQISRQKRSGKQAVGQHPARPMSQASERQFNDAWSKLGNKIIKLRIDPAAAKPNANIESQNRPKQAATGCTGPPSAIALGPKAAGAFAGNKDKGTGFEGFRNACARLEDTVTPPKRHFKQPHKCRECGHSRCMKHKWECSIHPSEQQYRPDCTNPEAFPKKCRKCVWKFPADVEDHARRIEQQKNDKLEKQRKNFKPAPGHDEFFASPKPLSRKRRDMEDDEDHTQPISKRSRRGAA